MRPTLLLDCDEILSGFVAAALDVVNTLPGLPKQFAPADVTGWDIWATLGLTEREKRIVFNAIEAPGFCRNIRPIRDALQGFMQVREVADVYVVTSPWVTSDTWVSERYEWLRKYFGIPAERVVHTSAKHLVRGDFFIDDSYENVKAWRAHNGAGGYLWNAPHNVQHVDVPRLFGWNGLYQLVKGPQ